MLGINCNIIYNSAKHLMQWKIVYDVENSHVQRMCMQYFIRLHYHNITNPIPIDFKFKRTTEYFTKIIPIPLEYHRQKNKKS